MDREKIVIRPAYDELLRHNGFSARWVFESPQVVVWRKLEDRENCTAEILSRDGRQVKLHLKRYPRGRDAAAEARGIELLEESHIPTAPLVAWGILVGGRGFVITEDLAGHTPADKLAEAGTPFAGLL